MQQRGMQVMHVHRVGGDVEPQFVGLAMRVTSLDAAAGQPQAETAVVVVATRSRAEGATS